MRIATYLQTEHWIERGILPAKLNDLPKRTVPGKALTPKHLRAAQKVLDKTTGIDLFLCPYCKTRHLPGDAHAEGWLDGKEEAR